MAELSELQPVVALSAGLGGPDGYDRHIDGPDPPELPRRNERPTVALEGLRRLFRNWRLDEGNYGTKHWNPLGQFIKPGAKVVIKPNWVSHKVRAGTTIESLITHTTVLQALLEYVALTRPGGVIIGDAPLQSCDFSVLRHEASIDALSHWAVEHGFDGQIIDFRRTLNPGGHLAEPRIQNARSLEHYVEFDLGDESLLTPLDEDEGKFRVTAYDPDILSAKHRPGRHTYLIAREVLEADVVLNVPKLKCHLKAGITGALKNLVGINGHKEYLPHHRKGGDSDGGDCYPGSPGWKKLAENALDTANRPGNSQFLRWGLATSVSAARRFAALMGADNNLEGSWAGNDTIWRMCLDLNRILSYGTVSGQLADRPQRRVISITDAIVAGEGDGPLRPTPVQSGFLTGSVNPAAADYVHARLIGFDPERIPIVERAFERRSFPLATFAPDQIRVRSDEPDKAGIEVVPVRFFLPPSGWRGCCELQVPHASIEAGLANI